MARLIDVKENPETLDTVFEDVTASTTNEPAPVEEKPVDDDIPEKYRGKDTKELIRMHQEAEKAYGRTGSEVGELRKIVDTYITKQLVESTPPPKVEKEDDEELDSTQLFVDPDKYLDTKLKNHPAIKALEEDRLKAERKANQSRLEQKHPDYKDIIQDNAFAEWIQASKVRTRLFIEADRGYDADAADELLSTWKERKALATATAEADKSTRKKEIKHASTGNARGSQAPASKKMYRRSDIMNLMTRDPERYQQLSAEILEAYRDKRVI